MIVTEPKERELTEFDTKPYYWFRGVKTSPVCFKDVPCRAYSHVVSIKRMKSIVKAIYDTCDTASPEKVVSFKILYTFSNCKSTDPLYDEYAKTIMKKVIHITV